MKKLVVFYSLEGNTRFIAENIAEEVKADILELKPKKEINAKGFMKYFWGGRQVVMGKVPELEPFDTNPLDYDVLFIGTPVWSFSYSPALRGFLKNVQIENKKIALFCCCQGIKANTFKNMEKALVGNQVIGQIDFIEPLADKVTNAKKTLRWVEDVIKGLE